MKWLFVTKHSSALGGIESIMREVANGLLQRGDQIHILCYMEDVYGDIRNNFPDHCQVETVSQVKSNRLGLREVLIAWKALRRIRPDIIFFSSPGVPEHQPFAFAARWAGVRHVIAIHGNLLSLPPPTVPRRHFGGLIKGRGLWRRWLIASTRVAYRGVTLALFLNPQQKESWLSEFKYSKARTKVWLAPINLDRFRVAPEVRTRLRSELEIDDRFVVGGVGRLVRQKSFHVLIQAIAIARHSCSNVLLLIIGDGPERESLIAAAKQQGVRNLVHFLGPRKDIPQLMNTLDAFVLPSADPNETLGIVVAEAMACGVPTLVTDLVGPSRLVDDEESGLVVPRNDPEALAAAIVRLCREPELRKRLAQGGLVRARDCGRESIVDELRGTLNGSH